MPSSPSPPPGSWLKVPIRTEIGTISLAGALKDGSCIQPESMRTLGNFALIFILSGQIAYSDANGIRQSVAPGDAILVFPDLAHAYGPAAENIWEQIYIVFNGPQFELLADAGILSATPPLWRLGSVEYWQHRLEELFRETPLRHGSDATRTIGRFVNLLTDMAATHAEAQQTPQDTWLSESMRLLSEPGPNGWLTPQQTAQRVGLSYENFRKLFAKRAGESPGSFHKRRRIEHACAMIYQGSRPFKELADEHGFCDVFHFSKAFTQVMGESPSDYRKRVKGS
ncbi:AraC family transcriptional regulator [Pelagicoccus sp. SDUM812002]|uniref:helix-turn-helix domain-containing protein n=1 Tax=Pelagicoccus sp. SDUM812002 TaxID=3041266 RepID=UPI00280FD870|nr:AraC family transcriptional regulator [Pelagicoccus sp. SDUM812002]MDQ8187672.1 AraC family transcriptional regulator [Pelagicoccus sp. SDUM812002]